jgi:thiazole synthase ThiGH ThiG subunit
MPEGAKTVVDAGTGQPLPKSSEAIKMTMEDVKVAAAKLAAKDTPALAKILKKYDASKLSEVDKAKLGDFAADVMEALG